MDSDRFIKVISSNSRGEFYIQHRIRKRSPHRGEKYRVVWQTGTLAYFDLIDAHKTFARRFDLFARLADTRFPDPAAFGFVKYRSTRENAAIHCGASLLLRADLRKFFPSISQKRLENRFLELGMKSNAAEALSKFATIDDALPLGLNASPMLANLVCVELDIKLRALANKYDCKYTRYADDISISGDSALPSKEELKNVILSEGFELSREKFRVTKVGQQHYVTGLSVSDPKAPHVPRRMKRRLRQELYYCQKFGFSEHISRVMDENSTEQAEVNRIDGLVHYVANIETRKSNQIKSLWRSILDEEALSVSYEPIKRRFRYSSCFVDECEISLQGKRYLALGLVFTENPDQVKASTIATLRKYSIEDPFYPGDRLALEKRGVHFSDAHPDLRTAYISSLATMPFQAFVIYAELRAVANYQGLFLDLFRKILRRRMIWYDQAVLSIAVEQNEKIEANALKAVVHEVYEKLRSENNRRPLMEPEISIGEKLKDPCLSVPDFILGVFARYAKFSENIKEKNREHQFERLRDKYRLIVNADTNAEYSRRHSFMHIDFNKR
jgi:hypothetical protein